MSGRAWHPLMWFVCPLTCIQGAAACSRSLPRLNRWRGRECEWREVSDMEELIVFLIVFPQSFCLVSVSFGREQTLPCVFYKMACLPKTDQNAWESAAGRETSTHEWAYCLWLCWSHVSPMPLPSMLCFLLPFCFSEDLILICISICFGSLSYDAGWTWGQMSAWSYCMIEKEC